MTIADKDKSGSVSKGELTIALGKYMAYIASADSMEELIAKHDKDGDSMLDNGELKALLQEATGTEAINIEVGDSAPFHASWPCRLQCSTDGDALTHTVEKIAGCVSRAEAYQRVQQGGHGRHEPCSNFQGHLGVG